MKTIGYPDFLAIVAQGRKNVSASTDYVMPAFGDNKNVVCYIDPIYVYLRARSNEALGRGGPRSSEPNPPPSQKPKMNAWDRCDDN